MNNLITEVYPSVCLTLAVFALHGIVLSNVSLAEGTSPGRYCLRIALKLISYGLPVLLLAWLSRSSRVGTMVKMPKPVGGRGQMFLPIFLLLLLWIGAFLWTERPLPGMLRQEETWRICLSFAEIVLLPAVCEEVFYRGVLLTALLPCGYAAASVLVAVLFSLTHPGLWNHVTAFLASLLLAEIYRRSGRLSVSVLCHFLWNAALWLLAYFV